jgi:hypothetical protein
VVNRFNLLRKGPISTVSEKFFFLFPSKDPIGDIIYIFCKQEGKFNKYVVKSIDIYNIENIIG